MQRTERTPKRVLVMMAHPDDPEFTAGGTIAFWRRQGAWVGYVICTGGDKGSDLREVTSQMLTVTRQVEQKRAALRFGIDTVDFLTYEDGALQHTLDLRRDLVRAIRKHKPDTVLCFDPVTRYLGDWYIQHADHYVSGEATLAAIYPAARNARTYPELLREGLEPHTVEQVYMAASNTPNRWFDIGLTMDEKVAAMLEHASQVKDPDGLAGFLRTMAHGSGATAEPQPIQFAEAFRFLDCSGG